MIPIKERHGYMGRKFRGKECVVCGRDNDAHTRWQMKLETTIGGKHWGTYTFCVCVNCRTRKTLDQIRLKIYEALGWD